MNEIPPKTNHINSLFAYKKNTLNKISAFSIAKRLKPDFCK